MFCSAKEGFYKVGDGVRREDGRHLFCLLFLFLVGSGIRVYFLFDPMRFDETYTFVHFAGKPLCIGLTDYHSSNNHPLHTLLVHACYLLLGNKPWVVRLPALAAGILIMPAAYAAIRMFYNKDAALMTLGLAAVSSKLVEYSVNARGYTLLCLMFLLILTLAGNLRQSLDWRAWLLFALLSALGAYTAPLMLLPFGVVVIWLFLSIMLEKAAPRGPSQCPLPEGEGVLRADLLKRLATAIVITGLLTLGFYLPFFIVSGPASVLAHEFLKPLSWTEFAREFLVFLGRVWSEWHRDFPAGLDYVLAVGVVISTAFHKRLARFRVPIAPVAIAWPIALATAQRALLSQGDRSRLWFFMLPLYFGLASAGISYLLQLIPRRIYRDIAVAIVCIVVPLWLGMRTVGSRSVSGDWGTVKDASQVAAFLKDYLRPTDAVVAVHRSASIFEYYLSVHGIDKRFNQFPPETSRIILITDESKGVRTEDILEESGASLAGNLRRIFPDYSEPRLVRRYDSASIYEFYKIHPR
jgi:hypothetical protein